MKLLLEDVTLPLAGFTLAVNLDLHAPVTGLQGPSGAGKTSLLEVIAGLRRPASGRVVLNSQVLDDASTKRHVAPEQRNVGYVPQDLALFPHLSVRANLYYGFLRTPRDDSKHAYAERVIDLLEIRALLQRRIQGLSGGEKQRVTLGRALLASPQILLLDEPLTGLDDRLKEKILPYLQGIRSELGVPMIYVTHSGTELELLCDEVLRVDEGKVSRQ